MKRILLLFNCLFLFGYSISNAQAIDEDPLGMSLDSLLNITVNSASKYAQTVNEVPASVTIITKEDIEQYGFNTVSELFTLVRGMYLSDDRNFQYFGFRGFSRPSDYNNRIAVMVNGHLTNENLWGSASLSPETAGINLAHIQRVEIIRGPGSSLYGNYAMVGVINFVLEDGINLDGMQVSSTLGSYGQTQGDILFGKRIGNDLDISVSARYVKTSGQELYFEEYDDSSSNMGIADRLNSEEDFGGNLQVKYKNLSFNAMFLSRDKGYPTGAYETLFGDERSRTTVQYGFSELTYNKNLSPKVNLYIRGYGDYYTENGFYPYDTADGGLNEENAKGLWAGTEARVRWDMLENNRLLVGGEFQQHFKSEYRAVDETTTYFDQNFPYQTYAFYLQDEYQPIKEISIVAGGRFDQTYRGKQAVTPRAAINVFVTDNLTFKALYGEAFRAPSVYEINIDDNAYLKHNFLLKPERIRSIELSAERKVNSNLFGTVSLYRNEMINLIDQVEDPDDALVQYQNVGDALGYGAEVETNIRLDNKMAFLANYSIQKMTTNNGNDELSNSPRHLLKFGASIPFLQHFRFATDAQYQSGRITVYDTETSAFLLWNGNLSFAPRTGSELLNRFHLNLRVRNILNAAYSTPGGWEHAQNAIIQNGRNFSIRLRTDLF